MLKEPWDDHEEYCVHAIQDPGKGKGGPNIMFAAAAALLQLRLLEAYLALPDASAYTMEHAAVSKLCARALRSAPGQAASGKAGTMISVINERGCRSHTAQSRHLSIRHGARCCVQAVCLRSEIGPRSGCLG